MSTTPDIVIEEKVKTELSPPKLWKVIFLNDNQTPMEFVIELLTGIFRHNETKARELTLEVHEQGSAVVGVYTFEIAEHRGTEASKAALENGFPLQIRVEEE
jgi:ATP-dependent Clp protease adaptor protein ClpS